MKKLFALSIFAVLLATLVAVPAQAQSTPLKLYHGTDFSMKFVDSDNPVNIQINHSITDDGAKFDSRAFTQEYSGSVIAVDVNQYDDDRSDSVATEDAVIARSFEALGVDGTVLKTYPNGNWKTADGKYTGREGKEAITLNHIDYFVISRVLIVKTRCYIRAALVSVDSKLSGGDVREMLDSFEVE